MASVFLSYDHEDSALARPLAQALEKSGHKVWFDRHIHGGAQYSRKIEQALDEADAVIVLWSERSLDSAWVRDEAAEGRDRNKLVPLSVCGVTPPMGFRQFQTIDLGAWKGRGKIPHLAEINEAVENQSDPSGGESGWRPAASTPPAAKSKAKPPTYVMVLAALAILLVAGGGVALWRWGIGRGDLPVVEVAAANGSSRSQAAASDLFVKLGSLAQVGQGKWQLVDASSAPSKPEFVFRTADTSSAQNAQANLVLLDGHEDSLLWSREFSGPPTSEADVRQQMGLTAGRVLGCALESREAGGLPRDLLKIFLDSCATLADASFTSPTKAREQLRTILTARPKFKPAWGRLLIADNNMVDMGTALGDQTALQELKSDIQKARALDPNIPELSIVELRMLGPGEFAKPLEILKRAAERSPNEAGIFAEQASRLQSVGFMAEGVAAAQRAAELDPVSPPRDLILSLAAAGQIEAAKQELARMARLWPGTGALRDALWAFHLRYGDPAIARRYAPLEDEGLDILLNARLNPTPANVAKVNAFIQPLEARPNAPILAGAIQALGEFNEVDKVYEWIARTSTQDVQLQSYILFRPPLKSTRKDPRFIAVSKRIGLLDYWRSSGKWPDFCEDPALPYDCKAEAAKLD